MTKKIVETQKFLRKVRNKFYEDTKNMSVKEKFDYISKESNRGKKRIDTVIKELKQKQNEPRSCQVLIRLTKSERSQLETDAKQERTTLSSLIRYRALKETNHLSTVITHLKKIEAKLK
ncbi:MAG: hypothetical protein LBC02_01110 [Planctomycetaceae bacterium]|jgi:hypothetical protein|nr:hypothetical protein [Planctomycetaceae bacterium]